MDAELFIAFAIAFAIWIAIAILARIKVPILSPICRFFWNIGFTIAAFVPFCGWMARFIIADDKDEIVEIGEETDSSAIDALNQSSQRAYAEQQAAEAERARRTAAVREREEELRARAYQKYGTRDVHLNSDGSKVRFGNGDYVPVSEFEKSLR